LTIPETKGCMPLLNLYNLIQPLTNKRGRQNLYSLFKCFKWNLEY